MTNFYEVLFIVPTTLPEDTILYPGHHYSEEESATLAETKEQNVYLRISDINTWRQIMG